MLSYMHGYHAGNFADVLKHLTLTRLLSYMTQKDKPLLYLDTHAGRGMYHLKSLQAQKTLEYRKGIEILWSHRHDLPEPFHAYIDGLKDLNGDHLTQYPGSPWWAMQFLREGDRLLLCELHPREFETLRKMKAGAGKSTFREEDGLKVMMSSLPPLERRGIIFIDPSYEVKSDYQTIVQSLEASIKRFETGIYVLWYPILANDYAERMVRSLNQRVSKPILSFEWYVRPKESTASRTGMVGSGLWILNPPFTLKTDMKVILKTLCKLYQNDYQVGFQI